ncbi:MauE/DoxX family redox-associated membrane protein [Amycolatopsis anabasis]|uniref:MauE/DoxX family redox-associated membrane protein n=1 Tax=Amycolatopsis anabasis TaxID=1840409 RepID=UPI00131B43A9|nr:MauE/DoxX family redox-associated membrane protein [Amycolatopsis anabasis]
MIDWVFAVQFVFVAGALAAAGAFKLFARDSAVAARRSALTRLVGADRVVAAFRLVGGAELALAAALLLPPLAPGSAVAALAWSLGMLGYLGYARRTAPDSSCGCLSAKEAPITGRSFARAGLLAVAGAVAAFGSPWTGLAGEPVAAAVLLLAEAAVFGTLSAELDHHWLLPLRRLRTRVRHPLRGTADDDVPVQASLQQLYRSAAYRSMHDRLRSTLLEHWDEGEWRMLTFAARQEGRQATAVFAVPRLSFEPERVRGALVNEPEPVF